mgnify:CR=1 FL=1
MRSAMRSMLCGNVVSCGGTGSAAARVTTVAAQVGGRDVGDVVAVVGIGRPRLVARLQPLRLDVVA